MDMELGISLQGNNILRFQIAVFRVVTPRKYVVGCYG